MSTYDDWKADEPQGDERCEVCGAVLTMRNCNSREAICVDCDAYRGLPDYESEEPAR